MKICTRTLFASLAACCVSISSADAAFIAYHDLAGPQSGPNITNAYVGTTNSFASNPPDSTVELVQYSDGTPTGVEVTISNALTHDFRLNIPLPPAAGTPAFELFGAPNVPGLDLTRGTLNVRADQGIRSTLTITITGLDDNVLYDIALFGDRQSPLDGAETFTIGGVDSAINYSSIGTAGFVTTQETRRNGGIGNPGHFVGWNSIDPGSDGIFVITMNPTGTGTNVGHLNALRLSAIPEPSSILIGLLGMAGLFISCRRRCQ